MACEDCGKPLVTPVAGHQKAAAEVNRFTLAAVRAKNSSHKSTSLLGAASLDQHRQEEQQDQAYEQEEQERMIRGLQLSDSNHVALILREGGKHL
jgi:hypothetical protein